MDCLTYRDLTSFKILKWTVAVPKAKSEVGTTDRLSAINVTTVVQRSVVQFQRHVRAVLLDRRELRKLEFEEWHKTPQLKQKRVVLTVLASLVLAVIAGFTLFVCVLIAAAFTEDEVGFWLVDVIRTFTVQVFVTGPVVGLLVIGLKVLAAFVLLRAAGKRYHQRLWKMPTRLTNRRAVAPNPIDRADPSSRRHSDKRNKRHKKHRHNRHKRKDKKKRVIIEDDPIAEEHRQKTSDGADHIRTFEASYADHSTKHGTLPVRTHST